MRQHLSSFKLLRRRQRSQRGFTLVELIVAFTIMSILALVSMQLVRLNVRRENERELRRDLWEMRDAIDRYKMVADQPGSPMQIKLGSEGYPPDLETLVKGVEIGTKKMRFLRRIPVDPMTGKAEWGMRSNKDDPDSDSWDGNDVFDVYSKSEGTAIDGTKYKEW
jgi:general secretion pathway protein G